ncbi:response regulator transcription factor [Paenibacillus sp. MWE-103]|uniref:Response regulator transcription factor n=1 Tax=Paenibacillus artemisiicola TaxID=1172618 RepID=A0ABS3W7G2_9BACL|nr:response regulator transcription factor [Paenibacillus artemisiicola]MBO7744240.1 response regulator transcription factor [Paenibacillus artemisiicola]
MQPMRILITDDHRDAREGIRTIIEGDPLFEVVGEARNGLEAIEMTVQEMPDLILMDINMKEMDGLEATKIIKERFPYIKIVMVTVSDDITHLFEAIKRGAQGYLLKNLDPSSWHDYLKAVALDEVPMSRELAFRFLKEFFDREKASHHTPLTPRETEILTWVSKGVQNREIASHLNISEHTVKNHLKNILQKLHLENRVQLARYAYERGLGMDR